MTVYYCDWATGDDTTGNARAKSRQALGCTPRAALIGECCNG